MIEEIRHFASVPDVTKYISDEKLAEMGAIARRGYEEDLQSIASWQEDVEEIRKYASQPEENKTYPWPDASNVRYPMILVAALQFNARAYPTIINNGQIILPKVLGSDPDQTKQQKANRVSRHMSFQFLYEMDEWEDEMDKLLLALPLDGVAFKKIYRDQTRDVNASDFVLSTDLIVNNSSKSLLTCPRVSHRISWYPHEIVEKINTGVFRDADYGLPDDIAQNHEPKEFIEQHTWFDLDEDGYPEPYIVTVALDSARVARVVANYRSEDIHVDEDEEKILWIKPYQYFVKYECFPDPEGGFYGKGFGQLLKPLNAATDSILNQLIDAGHLANTGGGFLADGFRIQSGALRFSPGEWKKVDTGGLNMKDAVMPLPIREPSQVLFSLLGLLIEAGKEVSSIQDVMTGGGGQNTPATTVLALIEQGMKVYTSIFKRVYRSLKSEARLLARLNQRYLSDEEYFRFHDEDSAISAQDYDLDSLDIVPAADPSMATDVQKAAKAQILNQYVQFPEANRLNIIIEGLRAAGIDDPENFVQQPPPDPQAQKESAEIQIKQGELQLKMAEMQMKLITSMAETFERMAKADEIDSDNLLNLKELMLGIQQLGVQFDDQGRRNQVEAGQQVVPGPDQGAQGPGGPAGA